MNKGAIPIALLTAVHLASPELEAAYGDLLWTALTGETIYAAPAIGPNGEVVVGSEDSKIYSFNPDGSLSWVFEGASDWIDSSPTIGPDGTVYAGSWDNYLYAIDGITGSMKWKFETGALIVASPAIGPDGTIFVASNDSFLYAVNPDGTQKWISEPVDSFSPINSSPVLNHSGDTVYFGNDGGEFFAVDTQTGLGRWSFDLNPDDTETNHAIVGSAAVGEDGNLYFGSENGYLYALSSTGDPRWSYKAAESIRSSPVISSDGTVYFLAQDGYLYALDAEGFQLWETFVGDVFYCSPALDAHGNIVLGAYAGSLGFGAASVFTSVNASGEVIWEYLIAGYNDSSPNIAPDGSIYIGAHDGNLYKFEGTAPLMDGQWPRFQANRKQTGFPSPGDREDLVDLFPGITRVENGWAFVPWFGDGWITTTTLPWIKHVNHGILYVGPSTSDRVTYFDPGLDEWLCSFAAAPNYLHSFAGNTWYYFPVDAAAEDGRWFYAFASAGWFHE